MAKRKKAKEKFTSYQTKYLKDFLKSMENLRGGTYANIMQTTKHFRFVE